ncbi:hypothetical protein E0K99_04705 [Faecalicoccus pleomorphus]|uniref:hypothetical protein n=1 Tax=Faecalicoccus pleomorphus TaxID=1323 RepID=UPI00143181B2|nr:hypothetical protein [Faecalicoccus pleomorphus]NJE40625.1 hypothetical protein [Faecalicoccus pleomorphus]
MANQGSVSIKIDLDNTDVNKKVSESEKKIEDLGDTAKKSLDGADFDDMAKGASRASGSLDELKQSAQQAQDDIEGLGNGMDRLPEQTKPASQGFTVFKGILADLGSSVIQTVIGKVGSLAGSLFDLIDATSEYSTMQAKLSGSATTFGYSVDYAKGQYQEFYKYLGDDQMATNAITNLLGMKVSTDTVSASASAAIGVWSAYGDSIPIESLTESMNESAQVAQVTGTLADAINWARRSNEDWSAAMAGHTEAQKAFNKAIADGETQEDAYSAALAACADTQERADLIAQTLNQTFGQSKQTYDELSQSTLDLNASELRLKDAQANLASSVTPLKTEMNDLKANALNALKPAVDKASGAMQDMIKDVDWDGFGKTAEDAMDTVVDALQFCIDHGEELTSVMKGAGTAFIMYKSSSLLAAGATKTATAALNVFTKGTKAAETAQKALNIAQKGSAWGLLAGLIAGAGVALVSYVGNLIETAKAEDENAVATEEMRQKYEELREQMEQNREAREANIESAQAESAVAETMASKIEELANKEQLSNAEKQLMAGYVDKLNEVMPGLNLQYDEEANKLSMSTQEIRNYISASKDMIMAKAYQENMISTAEDLAQAQMDLADAEEQVATNAKASEQAHRELDAAQKAYNDAVKENASNQDELANALDKARLNVQGADQTLKESKDTLSDYQDEVNGLTDEMDAWGDKINEALDTEAMTQKMNELVEGARAAGVEVPEALTQGIKDGQYALPESVEEMTALVNYDTLRQQATDAGYDVPESITEGIKTGELLPSQAVAQMNAWISFNDLLKESSAAGQQVPQWLSNGILSGQYQPQQAVQMMTDIMTFNDLLAKAQEAGIEVPADLAQGVSDGSVLPADAIEQIKQLMIEGAEAEAELQQQGKKNSESLGKGIKDGEASVRTSATQVSNTAVSGLGSGNAYDSGYNLTAGFARGISGGVGLALTAAANVVNQTLAKIRETGGEGSPWKTTTENGLWAMAGLEKGILDNANLPVMAAKLTVDDMGHAMYQTMEDTMSGLPRIMTDSFTAALPKAESKIVSRVKGLKTKMQDIISSSTAGRVLSNNLQYAGVGTSVVNQTTNNFQQTVNSAKVLRPSEMAREAQKMQRRQKWG